jgi:hypothetical protein
MHVLLTVAILALTIVCISAAPLPSGGGQRRNFTHLINDMGGTQDPSIVPRDGRGMRWDNRRQNLGMNPNEQFTPLSSAQRQQMEREMMAPYDAEQRAAAEAAQQQNEMNASTQQDEFNRTFWSNYGHSYGSETAVQSSGAQQSSSGQRRAKKDHVDTPRYGSSSKGTKKSSKQRQDLQEAENARMYAAAYEHVQAANRHHAEQEARRSRPLDFNLNAVPEEDEEQQDYNSGTGSGYPYPWQGSSGSGSGGYGPGGGYGYGGYK